MAGREGMMEDGRYGSSWWVSSGVWQPWTAAVWRAIAVQQPCEHCVDPKHWSLCSSRETVMRLRRDCWNATVVTGAIHWWLQSRPQLQVALLSRLRALISDTY